MRLHRFFLALSLCLALVACKSSEERAEEAFQRGLELIEAGDEPRARVEFRNAIRLDLTHVGAQMQLGRMNLRDGSLRPAFRNFLRVAEQEPGNLEAHQALSQISFLSQEWDAFDRHSARAIALAPNDPQVKVIELANRYRQAISAEDTGARPTLLAEAEALVPDDPDNPILRRVLIDGYLNEGQYEKGLVEIEKSIVANPRNIEFYQLKVRVLAQLGDNDGIEQELRRMVEAFPEDDAARTNLLRFLVGRGQIGEAEDFLRTAAEAATEGDTIPYVSLVRFIATHRGYEAALNELDARLGADPSDATLRVLRATLNFDNGNHDAGIEELEAVVTEESAAETPVVDLQRYRVTLATMLARTGNEVGARRLVEDILAKDPNEGGALKMRAGWLIEEDKTNEAITALRTALAESPRDADAMTLMAQAYERAGNTDLMLNFLSLAVESAGSAPEESLRYTRALLTEDRVDQALSTLLASVRLHPGNPELLSTLGRVYLRQDDRPRARQVIAALRQLDTPATRTEADAIELELVGREEGTEQALSFLATMSETHDENDRIKLALIRGLLQSGETAEALDYANELVRDNPDKPAYAFFQALTLAATQDFEGAEQTLSALVADNPNAAAGWLQLARIRAVTADAQAAEATIDEGLSHQPQSADLLWAKASTLESRNDIDGAIGIYETLYETNSNSLVVANNLASMLTTYRDDEESLERARVIARRLRGTEVPALQDTYGWILYRSGQFDEALTYLEPAAENLPDDANVQVHLGMTYKALGRTDEAQAQLNRAREAAGPVAGSAVKAKIEQLEAAIAE